MTIKVIAKHSAFVYATNGTYTMDYTTNCMPASTDFTSNAIYVGKYNEIGLHLKCDTDFTTPVATKYQISHDGVVWLDGATTLTSLDTGVHEWKKLGADEVGVGYIRFNANNTNAQQGKVLICISAKA